MQRIAPNAMPPRKSGANQPCGGKGEEESPAYRMARRIQREQGPQRAAQYLNAMEPFLAPAERAHIAERLGLRLSTPGNAPFTPPTHGPGEGGSCQGNGTQGPKPNGPGMGGAPGMGPIPGFGGNRGFNGLGSMGSLMQMMQMFQGLSGNGPGWNNAMGNPMQLAQMLGSLLGGNRG